MAVLYRKLLMFQGWIPKTLSDSFYAANVVVVTTSFFIDTIYKNLAPYNYTLNNPGKLLCPDLVKTRQNLE